MNNRILMEKLQYLWNKKCTGEESNRISTQIAVIRNAFGISIDDIESDEPIKDFDRQRVLSYFEIEKKMKDYFVKGVEYGNEHNDEKQKWDSMLRMLYYIDAVRFFDDGMADLLKNIAYQYI